MSSQAPVRPPVTGKDAERLSLELYGLRAEAEELPAERDRNFRLRADSGEKYVLKIHAASERPEVVDFQNRALDRLSRQAPSLGCPRVIPSRAGKTIETANGQAFLVRLLTFLPGRFLAETRPHSPDLLRNLGRFLGELDACLLGFDHPAMDRELQWDLQRVDRVVGEAISCLETAEQRGTVESFLRGFEKAAKPILPDLRRSVIHNDGNDYNVIVEDSRITGLIDFGDMLRTYTAAEPAIAAAYAMMGKSDPLSAAVHVVGGYHSVLPLTEAELEALPHLILMRLCTTVTMAGVQKRKEPDNEYLRISEAPAWALLERLRTFPPGLMEHAFRQACSLPAGPLDSKSLLDVRKRHVGSSLSVSYRKPLVIVRGWMQYLYDETGRAYLDAANNVPHVGHGHPRVVRAAQEQMAVLNTNTRYLHPNLVRYAERLTALFPEPLRVCFFVNSGSEANDLALRMVRAHTGRRGMVVLDGAYHGNLGSLIELSPYKFDGPGGAGAPAHVRKVPLPDVYRGPYRREDPEAARKYAGHVAEAIRDLGGIGAFIAESLPGCGGQIVLPDGFLKEAYAHVRKAGGLCIADEVQVGFGRVGTHVWGFETQGVVPDIVTLGKPIGNGHPLGAVVTTPEIAASFDNGMEYFNTFGGNPVSCAVGLAVLDVLRDEKLQENALRTGRRLKEALEKLRGKHALIGDVRGCGLYLGVELVRDQGALEPADREASEIAERMKDRGILLGVDGPLHNVLKIKPPIVFSEDDADRLAGTLDQVLAEFSGSRA